MEDTKTLLFYLLGLAGLIIVSILFTGRSEEPGVESLLATASPTKSAITPSQPENQSKVCASPPQKMVIGYIPKMAALAGNGLSLSGTVYAADFVTPLPDLWVDIWLAPARSREAPYYPLSSMFYKRLQTDGAGQYEVTIPRPDRHELNQVRYWVSDPNDCPLLIELTFIPEPAPDDASPKLMKLAEIAGSILRGPIDIVLPVPPPIMPPVEFKEAIVTSQEPTFDYSAHIPFRTNLIPPDTIGERLTISGTVYAADCLTPLPGVLIEVWQADPEGQYNFANPFYFRGKMQTDVAGHYKFTTLKPGRIFRYFQGKKPYLPLHIYYRLSYQDQKPLLTRLFFADDPFLENLSTPYPGLTISLLKQMRPSGPHWQGGVNLGLSYGSEGIKLC